MYLARIAFLGKVVDGMHAEEVVTVGAVVEVEGDGGARVVHN